MRTKLLSIKSLLMLCMMCVLGGMSAVAQETVTDVLTAGDFTATGTNYKDFSGVKKISDAVYAGNSAKNGGNIQLRSKNSTSGIVSTKSGGNIANVKIAFASANTNTIDVYGSNTAYTSVSDLYSAKTQGTKIGSLKADGSIEVKGDYAYIGIRSYNGACYVTSITIEWKKTSVPTTGNFTITSAGYATYFTDNAFVMPEGVTGYTITEKNGENLTMNAAYEAGATVPANTGLVLKGEAKDYTYNVTTTEVTAPEDNLLHGSVKAATTNVEGAVAYYKLADGDNGIGFYYGAENGAAFENGANKAYLAVKSANSQKQSFSFSELDNTVTAINTAKANATKTTSIYDINGRRLNTLNGAAKGLYIVNGQKVMVK